MKKVLILCTDDSCRSQIAYGYLCHFAYDIAEIYSAGITSGAVNQKAVAIMKLDGIDISTQTANSVTDYSNKNFEYVITLCEASRKNCPIALLENTIHVHEHFINPEKTTGSEEQIFKSFKKVRTQIKAFCETFMKKELL